MTTTRRVPSCGRAASWRLANRRGTKMAGAPSGPAAGQPAFVETGELNPGSLFVSFVFPRDALMAAGNRYAESLRVRRPAPMSSEIQTYVHELTHYLQYTTTPYGLFLQYCRGLQSTATITVVNALLDAGFGFRLPLLRNVPALTGETEAAVGRGMALWLNVENLIAMLQGDNQRRFQLLQAYAADGDRVAAGQQP